MISSIKNIDLSKIKNIIFDLGGVILNLDYELTRKSFEDLGISNFNEVYSQAKQDDVFDNFEIGKSSEAEFRNALRSYVEQDVSDVQIDDAWNAMLLDLPQERLELIRSLATDKRIFLLSNTNSIHIRAFYAKLEQSVGIHAFESLFEKIYYSHIIGMRKPGAEVFMHILDDAGIIAEETLFIDDSKQHVEGGGKCGINSVWLNGESIIDIFPKKNQAL